MPVEELEELFNIQIERDKFDSVGGLIFHLTGKIPATGDLIEGAGLQLTILDADERKIKKVSIARIVTAGEARQDKE
jgi:CBS domain containing-hemolysin-like protein